MEELLAEFVAETRETLAPLAAEIVAWEADPADRARLDSIFRFVHTVKGSCGFLDLPRLERLSHAAETALAAVRDGDRVPDRALVDAVLAIVDRIGELVEAIATGEPLADGGDEGLLLALEPAAEPVAAAQVDSASLTAAPRSATRSIRLPVELLDRMMAGVSDMVLARNELSRRLRERGGDGGVDAAFERLSASVAEMRDAITRTRMQRIDGLFAALPRMVRDLAGELGKQVRLTVEGGDVELDREMIEVMRDPLTHIMRNAIDHGLETPPDRVAAGKSPVGQLRVEARRSGNQILVEVRDDGRGIDEARLVDRAVSRGVVTPTRVAAMSRAERLDLIFAPGFSTASAVTAISGRGVGMDVVRANVEKIGGTVELDSEAGRGLRIVLRVPMTLTIIPALTFAVAGELFAVPRGAIDEIARVAGGSVELETVGGACVARIRGERLPVVRLATLLGLPDDGDRARAILIVVRALGGERYAMEVDAVRDHEELVVKPAAPAVMATGVYGGTTLPDNGRPMLVIDPAGVAQRAGIATVAAPAAAPEAEQRREATVPTLVFEGLDGACRAIRLALVERIEDVDASAVAHAAGRLRLLHEGRLLPLFGCDAAPDRATVRVLLLGDGAGEIAYAVERIADVHELPPGHAPADRPGPIAGVVVVDGAQVELLDPYWHFAAAGTAGDASPPVCLLDGDDPWMREMLAPIVERAGYRVVFDPADADAAVAILSRDRGGDPPCPAIRLRPTLDGAEDGSIWRYDRESLVAALAAARTGH